MKIIKLYTGQDNKSYFEEVEMGIETLEPLGKYSKKYISKTIQFREFEKNAFYDWHNAPQEQYIIYLAGKVEVTASGGEKRIFEAGHILFAADIIGAGHTTRTLTAGKSIIVAI